MKICKSCGVEFENGDGNYCCHAHRLREWGKTPEGKAKKAGQQRRYLEKHPEKKAESLEKLKDWNASKADEAYKRLVNPRCEITEAKYCIIDDEGYGQCGDLAEGCVWSSFTKKTPGEGRNVAR